MSTKPTLTYFGVRARGEFIRVLAHYLGVDFVDNRVASIDDELRSKTTFGQLPIYQDGSVTLAQTGAIARYIAEQHNFLGKTPVERAHVNEIVDSAFDIISSYFRSKGNAEESEKFKTAILPRFLNSYEKKLATNKHSAGGDDYTLADVFLFNIVDYVEFLGFAEVVKPFAKIQEHLTHFRSHANLSKYISSRPTTTV
ncbi:putative glutathione S-transferase [Tieghemostelium lacteum]|uniref:Putative glutathione S-transferase n=1 Tax=Tieghemostelium lacteum TaxID=361077 RepID=A0A151ZJL9_TIELA|nr:putative glutathione S-transferase [Tieghemostelium lacteum]|eukprot:KYQ94192.1 putative glutathione S-transferase [Tieghemostelium lacteum]